MERKNATKERRAIGIIERKKSTKKVNQKTPEKINQRTKQRKN